MQTYKNLLIIGGSGFIGTRLCKRLHARGQSFEILDKVSSTSFPEQQKNIDVRSLESLLEVIKDNSPIVNLAAEHRDNVSPKSLYEQVNVDGAKNICSVARKRKTKVIVFTSSVAVYGFAPIGTDECGKINPFNDYGKTKFKAEQIFKNWQAEDPSDRCLVIIRPTVVFGEQNRGNVYNLLKQIASGKFIMIGSGTNRKSVAYVENVAAFIEYTLTLKAGVHIFNYVDKPDFTMNELVFLVKKNIGNPDKLKLKLPYFLGYAAGKLFDLFAFILRKKFAISSIRVKKFCSDSVYMSAINQTSFTPPISIMDAFEKTIRYEFIEKHTNDHIYFSE